MADDVSMTNFLDRVLSGNVASENASRAAAEEEALENLRMHGQPSPKDGTATALPKVIQNAAPAVQVEPANSFESRLLVVSVLILGGLGLLLIFLKRRKC
jgi:hypothetical protein